MSTDNQAVNECKRTQYTKLYRQTAGKIEETQLSDEQLFFQFNAESNSIAIVVKHLWGNMLSRWADFLTTDGEKTWRDRQSLSIPRGNWKQYNAGKFAEPKMKKHFTDEYIGPKKE